jgi:tellurite resistance protein TerC
LPPVAVWHWFAFGALVAALLIVDLFFLHREDRSPSLRESAASTVLWCLLALAFNGFTWWWRGSEAGLQFLTGYLVEWSLSMDNVFVFAVIFRYFQVPLEYQYRVLFWGILGAVFMRLAFILAGAALIHRFDWVLPLFGVFLVYTAFKLARDTATEVRPEHNIVRRIARRFLPIATEGQKQYGHSFVIRQDHRLFLTPLFLVLLVIESTDVLFAVDSVPAIFGITTDPFTVFTSNIFAILGLRALYFLLAGVMDMFCYLHYGLAAVLGFVGLKMIAEWAAPRLPGMLAAAGFSELAARWAPLTADQRLLPPWASLVVIAALLGISVMASIIASGRHKEAS